MNWKRIVCYVIGCKWRSADGFQHGICGAFDCVRCGEHRAAIVWPKAPPIPECKSPHTVTRDGQNINPAPTYARPAPPTAPPPKRTTSDDRLIALIAEEVRRQLLVIPQQN